jgi:hypothetical protein
VQVVVHRAALQPRGRAGHRRRMIGASSARCRSRGIPFNGPDRRRARGLHQRRVRAEPEPRRS